ncbi:unnamed protein product [Parascedosporium putredinis]|uniref:Uncharacterized protein n=1 Tax=Parascedosporium putredinis TaxID=1442378 RepID=A0A9P1H2N2_9PEZI|nr:unnamed protein product [Parascedosporium putredinis]CAI7994209.1 unnamed protein product [Parascedosporium putredinis]
MQWLGMLIPIWAVIDLIILVAVHRPPNPAAFWVAVTFLHIVLDLIGVPCALIYIGPLAYQSCPGITVAGFLACSGVHALVALAWPGAYIGGALHLGCAALLSMGWLRCQQSIHSEICFGGGLVYMTPYIRASKPRAYRYG